MPIIKSAKKRVRTAERAAIRNSKTKRSLKSALKVFNKSLNESKGAVDAHRKIQSELDKAAKKNVMHKNKVARKKRQLAKAAKTAGKTLHTSNKAATAKKAPKATVKKKPTATKTAKKTNTK